MMHPSLIVLVVMAALVALIVWWLTHRRRATTTALPPTLALSDITPLGILRVDQVLGGGGTGNLTRTGNGCFWPKPNGKIAFFQIGQHAPEWFPSGWPIIEWEIDPAVMPGTDMATAPRMKYIRTVGDFFDGHIIASSGKQENWITGGFAPPEDLGDGRLRFRWTYSDGYTGGTGYPQFCMTDLHYDTGVFTTYGPWRIDVIGHRHISSQIIKLPAWFVAAHCPGYSYAAIGEMGSGCGGSPFGTSLIAIEDFDPTTKPPATNATDPATVKSLYLIHHGTDHKMRRPTAWGVCRWNGDGTEAGKYDCRFGATITPGLGLWGGTPNGGADGTESDSQKGVIWVDLPDRSGLLFFYAITNTPKGYQAPGDPNHYVHAGYANALHGTASGSGYPDRACCHGQFDPDWGSTGPFSCFHQPCVSIYPVQELIDVRTLAKREWACVPSTELVDWREVDPLFAITPPQHATDYRGVIFLSGTNWLDVRDRRLYVLSAYDFVTDASGARLPHLSVYQIAAGDPVPIDPPVPPVVTAPSALVFMSGHGSPEGVHRAPLGALYTDTDAGRLYVKESGTGATGWAPK